MLKPLPPDLTELLKFPAPRSWSTIRRDSVPVAAPVPVATAVVKSASAAVNRPVVVGDAPINHIARASDYIIFVPTTPALFGESTRVFVLACDRRRADGDATTTTARPQQGRLRC